MQRLGEAHPNRMSEILPIEEPRSTLLATLRFGLWGYVDQV